MVSITKLSSNKLVAQLYLGLDLVNTLDKLSENNSIDAHNSLEQKLALTKIQKIPPQATPLSYRIEQC